MSHPSIKSLPALPIIFFRLKSSLPIDLNPGYATVLIGILFIIVSVIVISLIPTYVKNKSVCPKFDWSSMFFNNHCDLFLKINLHLHRVKKEFVIIVWLFPSTRPDGGANVLRLVMSGVLPYFLLAWEVKVRYSTADWKKWTCLMFVSHWQW